MAHVCLSFKLGGFSILLEKYIKNICLRVSSCKVKIELVKVNSVFGKIKTILLNIDDDQGTIFLSFITFFFDVRFNWHGLHFLLTVNK